MDDLGLSPVEQLTSITTLLKTEPSEYQSISQNMPKSLVSTIQTMRNLDIWPYDSVIMLNIIFGNGNGNYTIALKIFWFFRMDNYHRVPAFHIVGCRIVMLYIFIKKLNHWNYYEKNFIKWKRVLQLSPAIIYWRATIQRFMTIDILAI